VRTHFDECEIDLDAGRLRRRGASVSLTPEAFDLLALLVRSRPSVVSTEKIADQVWPDRYVSEAELSNVIAEIRQALGDDLVEPRYVRTVQPVGYVFQAPDGDAQIFASPRWQLATDKGAFPLAPGENFIGRSSDAHVVLGDPSVSRYHARVVVSEDEVLIEDLNSKNGTYVAGRRIAEAVPLQDEDEIHVGAVRLVFQEGDSDAEPPAPEPIDEKSGTIRMRSRR
jgi:DNA-binding winged helix-turn-helix (wHTH) protein